MTCHVTNFQCGLQNVWNHRKLISKQHFYHSIKYSEMKIFYGPSNSHFSASFLSFPGAPSLYFQTQMSDGTLSGKGILLFSSKSEFTAVLGMPHRFVLQRDTEAYSMRHSSEICSDRFNLQERDIQGEIWCKNVLSPSWNVQSATI